MKSERCCAGERWDLGGRLTLDRVDKHRLVLNVAAAHTAIEFDAGKLLTRNFPDLLPQGKEFSATSLALQRATLERVESG